MTPPPPPAVYDPSFDAPDELLAGAGVLEQFPASSTTSDVGSAGEPSGEGNRPLSQLPPTSSAGTPCGRSIPRSAAPRPDAPHRKVSIDMASLKSERRCGRLLESMGETGIVTDSASSEVIMLDRVEDGGSEVHVAQPESCSRDYEVNGPPPPSSGGRLVSLSGPLVKIIGFQMSSLFSTVKFPLSLLYCSFLLVTDPSQTFKRGKDNLWQRLIGLCAVLRDRVPSLVFKKLRRQRELGKIVFRVAVGCFWSFYICMSLLICLILAFLIGRLLMVLIVEEPFRFSEEMNFDYTKISPVVTVPIMSGHALERGFGCSKNVSDGKCTQWLIPPDQNLHIVVSLTLPESDYNKKLGIFQLKVEVLAIGGKVITSSSSPLMLHFESPLIHFLKTLVRIVPLLAGYSSETQVLTMKTQGFTEGSEPTAHIRVTLKQRAEYRPGAGLPEIYAAHLRLESQLPQFKQFIWNWRRTLFVWVSIWLFNWEVLFILICCTARLVSRSTPRKKKGFLRWRQRNASSPGASSQ